MAGPSTSGNRRRPQAVALALLGGCVVILIGVSRGLDPDVVLIRALGSAMVVGVAASLLGRAMS